jgi:hypothetical protein
MEALTLDRAKELAAEVVAEFGEDYEYPDEHRQAHAGVRMCTYVHDGKPSCLVAQILHKHGVSMAELALWEFKGAWKVVGEVVPDVSQEVRDYLHNIQSEQDNGIPWADAVERFKG